MGCLDLEGDRRFVEEANPKVLTTYTPRKLKALEGGTSKSDTANLNILYLTPLDPHTYRRPIFAKLAMPQIKLINYVEAWRTSMRSVGRILDNIYRGLRKLERQFFRSRRWGGDYLLSAYYNDFVKYLMLIKKMRPHAVITLNTPLAFGAEVLGGDFAVIVDWMDVWMWPWDEMNLADMQAVEKADGVIFWSRSFMNLMAERLKLKKSTYVPHGIDLKSFDPPKHGDGTAFRKTRKLEKKFLITYSGGVWRGEGLDLQGTDKILKAFKLISNRVKDAVLVLQLLNMNVHTLKLLKELDIKSKTRIMSKLPFHSPSRLDLFSATDLFIAPSVRHPLAYYAERMKYFQYMAAAKPILAEKTPGAESVFGDTAYYVKLDDINALADGILRLYYDRDLREKLGDKSRKRVESRYQWRILIPEYKDFVLKVIS